MKILFLAKYINNSGVTTHMLELSRKYLAQGHEVALLSGGASNSEKAENFIKQFNKIGVKTFQTFFPKSQKIKFIEAIHYLISFPNSLLKINKFNPDIIHVHWPVTSFIPKIYKIITKTPFIVTLHLANIPNTILHQKADAAIAISNDLKKEIIKNFNYEKGNVYLVHNGVNKNQFKRNKEKILKIKKKLDIDKNKLVLTFVGSFVKRKGLDILFKACSKIINQVPDFELNLIGEGNEKWVNKLINKYKLKEVVNIFSFQDPYDFYNTSDIFILPSRKEGFPLVVLEAMLMEIAVIRSNTEGAYDQINDGENGLIFQNENAKELATKLIRLMNDDELREKIAKKGRETALNKFTSDKMACNTIEVYKQIINN